MIKSPDGNHEASLICIGEIRFGPPYAKFELDGKELNKRVFGSILVWSEDSRYLALEEWLTTNERKGPLTRLFLIDVLNKRYAIFKTIEKGFVKGVSFFPNHLSYIKKWLGTGSEIISEVDYESIKNWKSL